MHVVVHTEKCFGVPAVRQEDTEKVKGKSIVQEWKQEGRGMPQMAATSCRSHKVRCMSVP